MSRPPGCWLAASHPHIPAKPLVTPANHAADRARAHARWNPERETLELATAGAAQVLGPDHGVTKALAKAAVTMAKVDLWKAPHRSFSRGFSE